MPFSTVRSMRQQHIGDARARRAVGRTMVPHHRGAVPVRKRMQRLRQSAASTCSSFERAHQMHTAAASSTHPCRRGPRLGGPHQHTSLARLCDTACGMLNAAWREAHTTLSTLRRHAHTPGRNAVVALVTHSTHCSTAPSSPRAQSSRTHTAAAATPARHARPNARAARRDTAAAGGGAAALACAAARRLQPSSSSSSAALLTRRPQSQTPPRHARAAPRAPWPSPWPPCG